MPLDTQADRRVRVGLLGAGGIAPEHALALKQLPQVDLAAVCDTSEARARALASDLGVPAIYRSLAEMLDGGRLDVVHVLTPPQMHVPLGLECIQAGCDVFIEKPLGVSAAECRTLVHAASSAGRLIGVNQQLTYAPAFAQLLTAIREKKLGRLNHVAVSFTVVDALRDPNHFVYQSIENMILEYGPHPYSLVRRLLGSLKHMSSLLSGEERLVGGKSYFRSWQCSMVCERGTASLYLSVGRDARDVSIHVVGQDGSAFADLRQGWFVLHESSPHDATAALRGATKNSGRMLAGTAGKLWNEYAVKTKLKAAAAADLMSSSITDFYEARAAGRAFPEGGDAGLAVVEYCEQSAKAAQALAR